MRVPPPLQAGEKRAGILFAARKHNRDPEEIWRKCVCVAQGKRLCGVCVLHRRWRRAGEALFPEVVYDDTLAFVKLGAAALRFPRAAQWGTHAFRRGRADEVLRTQGPAALMTLGGWRGVAAFAYASARTRSEVVAAEEMIARSDSSEACDME